MKTTLIKILAILSLGILFSCEEYLDVSPEMGVTAEVVYSDYESFSGAVNRAVGLMHNYVYNVQSDRNEVGTYSDEAQDLGTGRPSVAVNKGLWMTFLYNSIYCPSDFGMYLEEEFHGRAYGREPAGEGMLGIRAVNLCLENYDKLEKFPEESKYTEEELRNQLLGQCYFLRGWFYFNIIMRYGPMPIMDHSYGTNDDFDVERPTYQVSNEFVIANMDSALKYLPADWTYNEKGETAYPSLNLGRPTQTTALAVKAQAYLFAASPLMNPDLNPYGSNSTLYNKEVAKLGIAAYVEALESALDPATRYEMYDWANYSENWNNATTGITNEAIFQPYVQKTAFTAANGYGHGWFYPGFDGGWGTAFSAPTQNAVDWFETLDGWDVEDAPAGSFDVDDPYSNRDPRLKNAIFCHGDEMYLDAQKATDGKVSSTLNAANPSGYHYEWAGTLQSGVWTGYIHGGMRGSAAGGVGGKHRAPGANKFDKASGRYRIFPYIRFAQLYLDYAELVNEVYGPGIVPDEAKGSSVAELTTLTAEDAVNVVRARVGMPNVRDEYLVNASTLRARIYNERAVEFFQEFKRWHDLRRWKIAKQVLAEGIWAADIRVDASKPNGYSYGKKPLEGSYRVFEDKHYWYPFPKEVINMMTVFKQNPGW